MSDAIHAAASAAIAALYTPLDRDAYLRACEQTPPVVHEVIAWLCAADYIKVIAYSEQVDPCVDISVKVQRWRDCEFVSEFGSRIRISRLAPVFHIEHWFAVENRYPAVIAPTLHGFGDAPYIAPQRELHEHVSAQLQAAGFTQLSLRDMDCPVPELLNTPAHASNNVPTVRLALFEGLLKVIEESSSERAPQGQGPPDPVSDTMHPAAKEAIDALYTRPDRDAIRRACEQTPPVVHEVLAWLRAADYGKVIADLERVEPSVNIWVDLQRWRDGEFDGEFTSRIQISRLAPVFYMEHGFAVHNRHPAPIEPVLRDCGDAPYITPQLELEEHVSAQLQAAGFTQLWLWDMDYPVAQLLGTPGHTSDGVPTVQQALFEDLLGVLNG